MRITFTAQSSLTKNIMNSRVVIAINVPREDILDSMECSIAPKEHSPV